MNPSLLEKINDAGQVVVATIIGTEGHTYKKKGEKALYSLDHSYPLYGNLGSLCADQEIVDQGKKAHREGKPRVIRIDTSDAADAQLGYGTYCGGMMEVLLEPVFDEQRRVYRTLRQHVAENEPAYLVHDLDSGALSIERTEPQQAERHFTEFIPARIPVFIFGATPLAHRLIQYLNDMPFRIHLADWRPAYLAKFRHLPDLVLHEDELPFDEHSLVVIISHSYDRDKAALKEALSKRCPYVGLLSAKKRRDQVYDDLVDEGIPRADLERVSSPIGVDIGGRSDPEIAVSIVAELVRITNT